MLAGELGDAGGRSGLPALDEASLEVPHHRLGDAGVGDAVHVAIEQALLVGGGEVAVAGDAFVIVVGDEVKYVLLEVGAGADDGVHLAFANHVREGNAELGRGHGPGEGDHHFATGLEVILVALGGIE